MSAPRPSAAESIDALVQSASSGDGPMLGDMASATGGASSAGSTVAAGGGGGGGVSGSSLKKLKNLQAANIYFTAHNIAKNDTNYAKFTEYMSSHGGADPPASLFSATDNGSSSAAPAAASAAAVNGSPPPPTSLEVSGSIVGGTVADGVSDASLGLVSPVVVGSSAGAASVPSSSNVSQVRSILMQCFKFTHPDTTSMKQARLFEVQASVAQLNGSKPPLSVLQTNLMYVNNKPLSTGSSAVAAAAAAAQVQSQNLSALPPGNRGQAQHLQEVYAQKRHAEDYGSSAASKVRKTAQEASAAEHRTLVAAAAQAAHHGTPMATYSTAQQQQQQQRNKMPMQPQQQPNGMPLARGPASSPSSSHLAPPGPNGSNPVAADLEQLARKVLARCQHSDAGSPTIDSSRLVQRVHNIVQRRSGGSVRLFADRSDSSLDRSAAALELLTVATETYLRNLIQSARAHRSRRLDASKSFLPVDVTSDPKSQLASLHKQEQERIARIKKHREIKAAQERKISEKMQAKAQAGGAAAAGAGASAAPVEKSKEEEAQAALLAKHEAAVAQVERSLRENRAAADAAAAAASASAPVGAAAGGAAPAAKSGLSEEEEYVRSMLSEALNPTAAAPAAAASASVAAPSASPQPAGASSSSASSALPPSKFSASAAAAAAMPPSQFNPNRLAAAPGAAAASASVSAAAAAAAAVASTGSAAISLPDLLAVMEAHSHLRNSSRFYQAQLALGAKKQQQPQQRPGDSHSFSSPPPQQQPQTNGRVSAAN